MSRFVTVILAGGWGSRMGVPKGLVEFEGRPWLLEQLRRYREVCAGPAVVVLGHCFADYFRAILWMEAACKAPFEWEGLPVSVVVNENPEFGQFSSLQAGARNLDLAKIAGVFVLPVDVPVAGSEVWCALKDQMRGEIDACIPVCEGQGGHPVLLSSDFLEKMARLSADSRLDVQLQSLPMGRVLRVAVGDPGVLKNMNTPADWGRGSR
ncbi:nucleotidyltransferase family protein [Bdellovibrionota bacterium FG-1]